MRASGLFVAIAVVMVVLVAGCGGTVPTATPLPVNYNEQGTPIPYTPTPTVQPTATPTPTESGPTPTPSEIDRGDGTMMKQYGAPPLMTIDPTHKYTATFKTAKGDIVADLFADKAPITVNNFVFLARQGFYDNTTFHRVLANFMAQGGDPTGTGTGGPGYKFNNEIVPGLNFDQPGTLGMANSGPNTNGSQFFITFVATPWLDGSYNVFGRVTSGMDVLLSLKLRDPSQNPSFKGDALNTVEITETP